MNKKLKKAIEEFEKRIKEHGNLSAIGYFNNPELQEKEIFDGLVEYLLKRDELLDAEFFVNLGNNFPLTEEQEQKIMLEILKRGTGEDKVYLFDSRYAEGKNRKIIFDNIIKGESNDVKISLLNNTPGLSNEEICEIIDSIIKKITFKDLTNLWDTIIEKIPSGKKRFAAHYLNSKLSLYDLIDLYFYINKVTLTDLIKLFDLINEYACKKDEPLINYIISKINIDEPLINYIISKVNIDERISLVFQVKTNNKEFYQKLIKSIYEDLYLPNDFESMERLSDFIYDLLSENIVEDFQERVSLKQKYKELTGKRYFKRTLELTKKSPENKDD